MRMISLCNMNGIIVDIKWIDFNWKSTMRPIADDRATGDNVNRNKPWRPSTNFYQLKFYVFIFHYKSSHTFFLADLWTHSMTFMNCSICSFGVKTWNILLFWLRKLCLSLAASWLRISHEECYYLSICNCVFLSVCIFVLANYVWVCWPAGRVLPTPAGRVSPAFQRFSHFLYREEP